MTKCKEKVFWQIGADIFLSLFLLGETNTHVLTFDVCMRMSSLASWTPWLTLTVAISFKIWESTDSSRIFSPRKSTESCRYLSQFWIIFLCNKCAGSWNSVIHSTLDPALGDRVSCTMTPIMTPLASRTPWTQPLNQTTYSSQNTACRMPKIKGATPCFKK